MRLFAAFLIVAALAAVSASGQQTPAPERIVVAEGSGQLTQGALDRLVDFFEWTLDTELTGEERAAFERETTESWKAGNCREIAGALYLLRLAEELKHETEDELPLVKDALKNRFLDEFERRQARSFVALLGASLPQRHGETAGLRAATPQRR